MAGAVWSLRVNCKGSGNSFKRKKRFLPIFPWRGVPEGNVCSLGGSFDLFREKRLGMRRFLGVMEEESRVLCSRLRATAPLVLPVETHIHNAIKCV